MFNKKTLLILTLVLVAGLVLSGCTKKAAESAAEKAIEDATNGQADVDIGTNSIKVNTNTGSMQIGGNVVMPDNFPDDVYVIDGTLTYALTTSAGKSYTITVETNKSVNEVKSLYESKLAASGWTININSMVQGSLGLGAQKSNRTVTITASEIDSKTSVSITTSENEWTDDTLPE
jgi:Flp pilus assembly protein TadG